MRILYYLRWGGTHEEFKEFVKQVKRICDGIEGIDLRGVFAPSSEWSAVLAFACEATNSEKGLEVYRTFIQKYGPHPKITLEKTELLFTFEELAYSP